MAKNENRNQEGKNSFNRKSLSKYKRGYCINCYTKIELSLGHRRGEDDIECPHCQSVFNINQLERFLENLSDIVEGNCPNCETRLFFNSEERIPGEKIKCAKCEDFFYINEVEKPSKTKIEKKLAKRQRGNTHKGIVFTISVIGVVVFFLESLTDILLRNYYSRIESFAITPLSEGEVLAMGIVGLALSSSLAIFLFFSQNKDYIYTILLIVALLGLCASYSLFGPIIIIISSTIGLIREREEKRKNSY